jgi:hypothetical protein
VTYMAAGIERELRSDAFIPSLRIPSLCAYKGTLVTNPSIVRNSGATGATNRSREVGDVPMNSRLH